MFSITEASQDLESRIFNISTFVATLMGIGALIINLFSDLPFFLNVVVAIYVVISGTFFYLSRFKRQSQALIFLVVNQIFLSIMWFVNGGMRGSIPYSFFIILFLALVAVKLKPAYTLTLVMSHLIFLMVLEYLKPGWVVPYADANAQFFDIAITLLLIMVLLAMWVIMLKQNYDNERANVEKERQKSEQLLLNILPAEIAEILKGENRVIADYHAETSILFADLVNFTPMSAQMTPIELVELLDEVFSYFDVLVAKYGLEKIKTIGDCYMVAAGVPRYRPDHAYVLTCLALEIHEYVSRQEIRGKHLSFRIGINSGPLVAGVIGRSKSIYDLWGDTVNTASRMESHGVSGSIQITEATYQLIKDDFTCEPQGVINVKGKGEMKVWYVLPKAE
jgi:class 3 adenylate cyclase